MKGRALCAVLMLTVLAAPAVVRAQQDDEPVRPFVYSTYYECDIADQGLADMIWKTVQTPIYDAAVDDGTISAWGWLVHHTGGKWRRASYFTAPTIEALMAAQEILGDRVQQADSQAAARFSRICGAHDDYIWQSVTGSGGEGSIAVAKSGEAGVSQYMVCKMSEQERADELVKEVFAPIYDGLVADGKLSSWGWLEHSVGGEYRRLFTLRGADHATVLEAWGDAVNQMEEKHESETKELNEICYSHQDYIWTIAHRK
jgi:hypothetical protein